jgi:hypothetical protein
MNSTQARLPERVERWPVGRLVPYVRNPRTHTEEQIAKIAASIREFGFTNPILVADDTILAGHGRLRAAQLLGLDEVPVIDLSHLSEAQRRAYVIADNRLALDAGWDETLLEGELAALQGADFDLTLTGFTDEELADLLPPTEPAQFTAATAADQGRLDRRALIVCPNCQHEFPVNHGQWRKPNSDT